MRPILIWAATIAILATAATPLQATALDYGDNAAWAINDLSIDLIHQFAKNDDNFCLSPYSIQSALLMTFDGADGETHKEMSHVLHFPSNDEVINYSFSTLRWMLNEITNETSAVAEKSRKHGGPSEPITLSIANRLFGQSDYEFRDPFRELVKKLYDAPFETFDFKQNPEAARAHINKWVADQTRDKIHDLIPQGGIKELTRLVLANAIYLKAPWAWEFNDALTKPKPFHIRGGAAVDVPMMEQQKTFGYAKWDRFIAVTVPYSGSKLQFLILLPDEVNGLAHLESNIRADILKNCANLPRQDVDLELPKFKFAPPTIPLKENLMALGMKTAFDDPPGSANFDKMSPRRPDKYLAISNVFHKTFIAVDEKGTEAAAATAVVMMELTARREIPKEPIHVKVDRPFLYAIQHVPSGACLFIGRVTDPR